jgi:hypothetical protein
MINIRNNRIFANSQAICPKKYLVITRGENSNFTVEK